MASSWRIRFCAMILVFTLLSVASVPVVKRNKSDIMEIKTKRFQSVILPCPAKLTAGVEYQAVRWYKEGKEAHQTTLLTKDLPDGRMRWFVGASAQISLVQHTLNLQLPNVSCCHRGVYQCYLAAPVGQQNREGRVRLTVSDCPAVNTEAPLLPVLQDAFKGGLSSASSILICLGLFMLCCVSMFPLLV